MARIKHIALSSEDPAKTAAFYQRVFGLQELHRRPADTGADGVWLSDGYIYFAILKFGNEDTGHTKYFILMDLNSRSETSHWVGPTKTIEIELYRCLRYELRVYDQDEQKDDARLIAKIDESMKGNLFAVR